MSVVVLCTGILRGIDRPRFRRKGRIGITYGWILSFGGTKTGFFTAGFARNNCTDVYFAANDLIALELLARFILGIVVIAARISGETYKRKKANE